MISGVKEVELINSDLSYQIEEPTIIKRSLLYTFVKRSYDIFASGLALLVLSPFLLIISLIMLITDYGPILYSHKRVGKNGKSIKIYKFRSMRNDKRPIEEIFTKEQLAEFKINFKLDKDPRVTKFGNFLRKTSLDELPQLFNILKGDLSIVGPRPLVQEETERYNDNRDLLLSVRPGLTGYWAANGRSNTTYKERMNMELHYVRNMSLILDIKIIIKTFFIVLKRTGAK